MLRLAGIGPVVRRRNEWGKHRPLLVRWSGDRDSARLARWATEFGSDCLLELYLDCETGQIRELDLVLVPSARVDRAPFEKLTGPYEVGLPRFDLSDFDCDEELSTRA